MYKKIYSTCDLLQILSQTVFFNLTITIPCLNQESTSIKYISKPHNKVLIHKAD